MTMEYHEAASIFPLDEEHIAGLAKDIKKQGLLHPIETIDGKIIDGRRRLLACRKAKVEPRFTDVKGLVEDPVAYVLSLNLHRRHLTVSQAAMCAARARKMYDDAGKKRQREHGGTAPGKVKKNTSGKFTGSDARDQAGKAFGVSGRTVDYGTRVLNKGVPELIAAVNTDRIAVSTAAKVAAKPPKQQREFLANAKGKPSTRTATKVEPEPEPGRSRGVGVARANEAVDCLKRIPKNDRLRKRGFQIVTDWIRHNK